MLHIGVIEGNGFFDYKDNLRNYTFIKMIDGHEEQEKSDNNYYDDDEDKDDRKYTVFFHMKDKGTGSIVSALEKIRGEAEWYERDDIAVVFDTMNTQKGDKAINVETIEDALENTNLLESIKEIVRADKNAYFFIMNQLQEKYNAYFSGICCEQFWVYQDHGDHIELNGPQRNTDWYNYKVHFDSKTVVLPDQIGGKPVTCISQGAFSSCSGVEMFILPESVDDIGANAFYSCEDLKKMEIPKGVEKIKEDTFEHCESLETVDILGPVTQIEKDAFAWCKSLREINIPPTLKSIGEGAFCSCSVLTSIDLPEGLTSIGEEAFRFCSGLENIEIPKGIKKIENQTFEYCRALSSLRFNEGLEVIGEEVFVECHGLERIVLPQTLTTINKKAFHLCGMTMVVPSSVVNIDEEAWDSYTIAEVTPGSSAEQYCKRHEYRYKYSDSDVIDIKADRYARRKNETLASVRRSHPYDYVGVVVKITESFRRIGGSFNGYPSFEAQVHSDTQGDRTLFFGGHFYNAGKRGHNYRDNAFTQACQKVHEGTIIVLPYSAATSSYIKICTCPQVAYSELQYQVNKHVDYQTFEVPKE